MASSVFTDLVSRALDKEYTGDDTTQVGQISAAAEAKAFSLAGTFSLRAEEDLSDEDMAIFEARAAEFVSEIIDQMANEDIEKLVNQEYYRENKKSTTDIKGTSVLRDKRGRFISPANLERLLNLTLYKYALVNMGQGGQLVNRTGRLAGSGTVTGINVKNRNVSFFYTYMLYPYEVFENSVGQPLNPDGRRSPVRLFREAIDMALKDLLSPTSLTNMNKSILFRGDRRRLF